MAIKSKKSWQEFKDTGLLWWINRSLHLFGWAIILEYSDANEITDVYPARVLYRGFTEANESKGFKQLSSYMEDNAKILKKEVID